MQVKGKSEKVTIYEVFDVDDPECIILKNKTSPDFKKGLALSYRDKFGSAKPFFEKILQANPNDKVAQVYLDRCDKILSIKIPDKPKNLIVDDTPLNLKLLSHTLSRNNFEVTIAKEGKKALKLAELKQPHLILLDVMMPDMDGFEVCRRLKANPKTQDIPIIFITALSESEDKVKGFQLGGVDYITKPFNWEEVLVRMKTHLHLSHLQRQASWYVKAFKKMQFETSFTDDI